MSNSLQELLAELQRNYLASFPEKITNLESLWMTQRFEELTTEYHKLKGTGRTYGLPEVTQLGEILESICEHHMKQDDQARLKEVLAISVPLSLKILEFIRESRTSAGEEYLLDNDSDFIVLLGFLPKRAPRAKRHGS